MVVVKDAEIACQKGMLHEATDQTLHAMKKVQHTAANMVNEGTYDVGGPSSAVAGAATTRASAAAVRRNAKEGVVVGGLVETQPRG